jgi:MFS family permease
MFAVTLPVEVMLAVLFAAGLVGGAVNPLLVTVRMERIPPELRGRVFATTSAIAMAAQPIGIVAGGALVDAVGVKTAALTLAAISQLIGVVIFLQPVWRHLDDTRPGRAGA